MTFPPVFGPRGVNGVMCMADYLDVLVLCSDPVNLGRTLNLAQELVHFEHVIRDAGLPIRLRRVMPPTRETVTQRSSCRNVQSASKNASAM